MEPLSACILLGETVSPLLLLMLCTWWIVATDDSESLEALEECDRGNGCGCSTCSGFCVNLIRVTFIFGEGVNDDDDAAVDDDSLLLFDGIFL
jgi:hypothetical protein